MPPSRLFEEISKLFCGGMALQTFEALRQQRLFRHLFPVTEEVLEEEEEGFPHAFISVALDNMDRRVAENRPVTIGFLFSSLLWDPMCKAWRAGWSRGMDGQEAMEDAMGTVLREQNQALNMPKHIRHGVADIWRTQQALCVHAGARPDGEMPRNFRAAYDFLRLRHTAGETDLEPVLDFWREEYENTPPAPPRGRRRRGRRPRNGRGRRA